MAEVTYLLGAGASADRIPVVTKIGESIATVIDHFRQFQIGNSLKNHPDVQPNIARGHLDTIIADLLWMETHNKTHSSIDTYAKKLYLTQSTELGRLKLILSFYFTYLQILDIPDMRYDNFWASILSPNRTPPKKIKILS